MSAIHSAIEWRFFKNIFPLYIWEHLLPGCVMFFFKAAQSKLYTKK